MYLLRVILYQNLVILIYILLDDLYFPVLIPSYYSEFYRIFIQITKINVGIIQDPLLRSDQKMLCLYFYRLITLLFLLPQALSLGVKFFSNLTFLSHYISSNTPARVAKLLGRWV
jgi:hypothetical protein